MKLAIIEDRIDRLNQYADEKIKKIDILDIISENKFEDLEKKLAQGSLDILINYDCLMVHRSALNVDQRTLIIEHCETKCFPLVFFSGSISSNNYRDAKFPLLYINSKDFYSDNLLKFIDDIKSGGAPNLLILQFGERWRLNALLKLRNRLNYQLRTNSVTRIIDINISKEHVSLLTANSSLKWLNSPSQQSIPDIDLQDLIGKVSILINDSL